MDQPFENPFTSSPPPLESDPFPVFSETAEEVPRDELLENMTRLLLHMEAELQFKEAVIEILLRNSKVQEKVREDLKDLKSDEFTDPLNGLARDRAFFDQQAWEECFEGFPGFDPVEDPGFFRERPCYLAVVSGVRAMQVAQAQYERYIEKSQTLQRLVKQHNKLKAKYSSATRLKDYEIAFSGDTLLFLQQERSMLQETLEWERKQNQTLNNRLQILEQKLEAQAKRSTRVVNLLLVEIERLSRLLIELESQRGTGSGEEDEVVEEEYELFSDEESTYFNQPDNFSLSQYPNQYSTIKSKRKSRNMSERQKETCDVEGQDMDNNNPTLNGGDCPEVSTPAHYNKKPSDKAIHLEKSKMKLSLLDTANQFAEEHLSHNILVTGGQERTSFVNTHKSPENEHSDTILWRDTGKEPSRDDPWVPSRSVPDRQSDPEVVIQATLTGSCVN